MLPRSTLGHAMRRYKQHFGCWCSHHSQGVSDNSIAERTTRSKQAITSCTQPTMLPRWPMQCNATGNALDVGAATTPRSTTMHTGGTQHIGHSVTQYAARHTMQHRAPSRCNSGGACRTHKHAHA